MQSKVVRDLLWILSSSQMVCDVQNSITLSERWYENLSQESTEWIKQLDRNPIHLQNWLKDRVHVSKRNNSGEYVFALGMYAGYLLQYWIECCPCLHAKHVIIEKQILAGDTNRTVGQLKFLFQTIDLKMHWECSVKFFLLANLQDQVRFEEFVGPDLGENLAWRVLEFQRKRQLAKHKSVQAWLETTQLGTDIVSKMVLKGYLFYPLEQVESTTTVHDIKVQTSYDCINTKLLLSPGHNRGWWSTNIDMVIEKSSNSVFVVLKKLHWLSSIVAIRDNLGNWVVEGDNELGIVGLVVYTKSEFKSFIENDLMNDESLHRYLVAELRVGDETCVEISRGFILPNTWDPTPMCKAASRFRRVATGSATEREYDVRTAENLQKGNYVHRLRVEGTTTLNNEDNDGTEELLQQSLSEVQLVELLRDQLIAQTLKLGKITRVVRSIAARQVDPSLYLFRCICHIFSIMCPTVNDHVELCKLVHACIDAYDWRWQCSVPSKSLLETNIVQILGKHNIASKEGISMLRCLLKLLKKANIQQYTYQPDIKQIALDVLSFGVHDALNDASCRGTLNVALSICGLFNIKFSENELSSYIEVLQSRMYTKSLVALNFNFDNAITLPMRKENKSLLSRIQHLHKSKVSMHDTLEQFETIVVESLEQVQLAMQFVQNLSVKSDFRSVELAGIDCEWQPTKTTKGDQSVCLVQISISNKVFLFDLLYKNTRDHIVQFFSLLLAANVILFGFCILGDLRKLLEDYSTLRPVLAKAAQSNKIGELRTLASHRMGRSFKHISLAKLALQCINLQIEKEEQCSNWGFRPLSPAQRIYAAMDAVSVLEIAKFLLHQSPPIESWKQLHICCLSTHCFQCTPLNKSDVGKALIQHHMTRPIFYLSPTAVRPEHDIVVKTIGLKSGKRYCACILDVQNKIDFARIAVHFGTPSLPIRLATREELVRIFGYAPGCLGPIGLRSSTITILLDAKLIDTQRLLCGGGNLHYVYAIKPSELLSILDVHVFAFSIN